MKALLYLKDHHVKKYVKRKEYGTCACRTLHNLSAPRKQGILET